MDKTEIEEQVKAVLSELLGMPVDEITLESDLTDDLSADSLDKVEIIMRLEQDFKIAIPDDDAEKVRTVGDAVNEIANRLEG